MEIRRIKFSEIYRSTLKIEREKKPLEDINKLTKEVKTYCQNWERKQWEESNNNVEMYTFQCDTKNLKLLQHFAKMLEEKKNEETKKLPASLKQAAGKIHDIHDFILHVPETHDLYIKYHPVLQGLLTQWYTDKPDLERELQYIYIEIKVR